MKSHQWKESIATNKCPVLPTKMSHPEHTQVRQCQRSQCVRSVGQSNGFSLLPEKGTGNSISLEELGDLSQLNVLLTLLLLGCATSLSKATCYQAAHGGLAGVCIFCDR